MCPWAFSTQPKSHRRTHTDNSTALHCTAWLLEGHSKNSFQYIKKRLISSWEHMLKCACKQMDTKKHAIIHGQRHGPKHSYCQTHTDMFHWLMHKGYICAQLKGQEINHLMSGPERLTFTTKESKVSCKKERRLMALISFMLGRKNTLPI